MAIKTLASWALVLTYGNLTAARSPRRPGNALQLPDARVALRGRLADLQDVRDQPRRVPLRQAPAHIALSRPRQTAPGCREGTSIFEHRPAAAPSSLSTEVISPHPAPDADVAGHEDFPAQFPASDQVISPPPMALRLTRHVETVAVAGPSRSWIAGSADDAGSGNEVTLPPLIWRPRMSPPPNLVWTSTARSLTTDRRLPFMILHLQSTLPQPRLGRRLPSLTILWTGIPSGTRSGSRCRHTSEKKAVLPSG
ncbi:hypothetical protein MAPG_01441 [Magnaporthiopsis poae ATCC 64411]|uniref:Uncharacterized protein n=1 Tax=Magnaporthiopsis poae (strain ATCC 64411 / 73-15) TaxID=644358 RepID=A0A0C4DNP7_MAGP6|nr:hypothetical protein MAPG_01441 [Magnaporthiopsis poae ATCC 64411]